MGSHMIPCATFLLVVLTTVQISPGVNLYQPQTMEDLKVFLALRHLTDIMDCFKDAVKESFNVFKQTSAGVEELTNVAKNQIVEQKREFATLMKDFQRSFSDAVQHESDKLRESQRREEELRENVELLNDQVQDLNGKLQASQMRVQELTKTAEKLNETVQINHRKRLENDTSEENETSNVNLQQDIRKCRQWEPVGINASTPAPPPRAPPGYELVPGLGYYKLHNTPKPWLEARQICFDEGAHLSIVNSEEELLAIQGIYSLYPRQTDDWRGYYAYVGYHDIYTEGKYITIFGDSLESTGYFKTVIENNPTAALTEDCGCIHRTANGLYDSPCEVPLVFICEQELV